MGGSVLKLIQIIVVLIGIIAMVNIFLKFLNKNMKNNRGIVDIVDRTPVTNTSSLAIVKVVDKYYLMSLSDSGNSLIKELDTYEAEEIVKKISINKVPTPIEKGIRNFIEKRAKSE